MAVSTAETAKAVVRPAINIIRRTRANSWACSGVGSGRTESVMQVSSVGHPGRLSVTVAGDEGSARLDRVLAARLPDLSRSRLKALILAGQVQIGTSAIRDPAYHVGRGDTITIDLPEAAPAEPQAEA